MKPNYLLIKTECVNHSYNTPCHIILQEVVEGEFIQSHDFLINPEEELYDFDSPFSKDDLIKCKKFPDAWPDIHDIIIKYPVVVGAADALSMCAIYNALIRYHLDFEQILFVGARNLCRRGIKSVLYNIQYLYFTHFGNFIDEYNAMEVANAWTLLVRLALDKADDANLEEFCSRNKIHIGSISMNNFDKSHIIKDYSHRRTIKDIQVDVQRDENNPFCDMSVVFTGKLEHLTRLEAQKMVLEVGGHTPKGVTKLTDYLVVGEQDLRIVGETGLSGKMKKAQELHENGADIEIIGEKEFLSMINGD